MYSSKAGAAAPAFLFIGPLNSSKRRYSVDSRSLPSRHLIVTGDFCQKALTTGCETHLPQTHVKDVQGFVYAADGSDAHNITVHSIDETKADIEFLADPGFRPLWLVLRGTDEKTFTFPYVQAKPDITSDVIYQAFDLPGVCGQDLTCGQGAEIKSVSPSSSKVEGLGVKDTFLFARVTGPAGEEPDTVVASLTNTSSTSGTEKKPLVRSVLLRRVTKPASDQSLLNVSMTIMDQETVRRNYGYRIAGHYIAVKLDLANRTSKKLQFNKSAIWFDADYRAVGKKNSDYWESLASGATGGARAEDAYRNPFRPYTSKEMKKCETSLTVKPPASAGLHGFYGQQSHVQRGHVPLRYRAVLSPLTG